MAAFVSQVYNTNLTPDIVNSRLKDVRAFDGALLYWSRVPLAYPKFKWIKRAGSYNNAEVRYYVYTKKIPVLVQVNAWSIGAAIHWILFLGDQKALDPWTGTFITTAKYPPTGYALYTVST